MQYQTMPTQLGSALWSAIAAGSVHALGVQADGTLWAWGNNTQGQSGIPSFSMRPVSVQAGMRLFAVLSLTTMSPGTGVGGTTVTITGVGLGAAQLVTFGGVVAPNFTVNSAGTVLTVVVPAGAVSGRVAVLGPDGTAWSSTSFQVLAAPAISSFAPLAAAPGSTVTVNGTGLSGATSLLVGGVTVTGFVVGPNGSTLTFVVPTGSSGGFISITTPGGTATSATALAVVLAVSNAAAAELAIAPVPVRSGQPLLVTGLPAGAFTVEMVSILGQPMGAVAWPVAHPSQIVLGAAPARPGVYLLMITTDSQHIIRRVIVE